MKNKSIKITWLITLILLLTRLIIIKMAKFHADWVEQVYSRGIYPIISRILTGIANVFPFSIGEILILGALGFLIVFIIKVAIHIYKKEHSKILKKITSFILVMALFIGYLDMSWLMNNYRLDVVELMGLPFDDRNKEQLGNLFETLVLKTNDLKENISNESSIKEILYTANDGYKELSKTYEFISRNPVIAKGLISSKLQTISGYTGVYLFFIGEPTINTQAPVFSLPHTACHEVAHQKGFAMEEDANYLGFLACKANKSTFFQYSGYYAAMQYVGSALYKEDPGLYYEIAKLINEQVLKDMNFESSFWNRNKNKVATKVVDQANDSYLKSYNQPEGLKSYGKFVDLLLADYIKHDYEI